MKPKVAVVTGHHTYNVPAFHELFRSLKGVDPYIQHVEDFCSSSEAIRDSYDAVVFYTMVIDGPKNDMPWWWGEPLSALSHLGKKKQGLVILHHALCAFTKWNEWEKITGVNSASFSHYSFNETIPVKVIDDKHPITRGLKDWTYIDETYVMNEPKAKDNRILLMSGHHKSMASIAWARKYKKANVFSYQLGHDAVSWVNPNFKRVLERGILWSCGKLK